jgi:hypothetical protein
MKGFIILLVTIVVLGLLGSMLFVGHLARAVVEKAGPRVLGVPIHLTSASFNPLRGRVTIKGFTMGNPQGFQSQESVGLGRATVLVKPAALFRDPLVIDRIEVVHPRLTYEINLGSSNFQKIQEKVASSVPAQAGQPAEEKAKKAKKVIIRDLLVEKGEVGIVLGSAGGIAATLPLPTIHLTNVGNETGGAAAGEVLSKVLGQVVSSVGSMAGNAVSAAGDAAGKGAEVASDAASKAIGKVGGLLGVGKKH